MNYSHKDKNMNLEKKKILDQIKRAKPKQIWVKKTWVKNDELKCQMVIHSTL